MIIDTILAGLCIDAAIKHAATYRLKSPFLIKSGPIFLFNFIIVLIAVFIAL